MAGRVTGRVTTFSGVICTVWIEKLGLGAAGGTSGAGVGTTGLTSATVVVVGGGGVGTGGAGSGAGVVGTAGVAGTVAMTGGFGTAGTTTTTGAGVDGGGGALSSTDLLNKLLATNTTAVAGASISIQSSTVRSSLTTSPFFNRARMLKCSPGPERTLSVLGTIPLVAGSTKPA